MSNWQPPGGLPDLRHVGLLAIDTETNDEGLRDDRGSSWPWRGGHVCGVSVAWRGDNGVCAHYFSLQHPDSENFERTNVARWLKDLSAAGVRFATQNGLYDWGWLRSDLGVLMPPSKQLEEIGALATLVNENLYSYRLEALCEWRGLPGKDTALLEDAIEAAGWDRRNKRKTKINVGPHIYKLPAHLGGPYAEADAIATLALFEDLDPILDQENTRNAYRLDVDLLPMVHAMRRRGLRVDQNAAEQARDHCLQKRDRALADLSDKLGAPIGMDEIASPKWKATTFDAHGIGYPRTAKGNPSFKAGKLGWMGSHEHWLPQLIAVANKYDAGGSKFLEGHVLAHLIGDRIYAEINPFRSENGGTKSFRFSYSDPPLQQMPSRDEELGPLIRSAFLPEPGETWCTVDCSQQEFRLVAHHACVRNLAGASQAAERYRNDPDTDFHLLAAEITGLPRKDAKAVNFAKIYGAGVAKFAEMIGRPLAEAQTIYAKYDQQLPFLSQLSRACQSEANHLGYTLLYDGARRHWDRWATRSWAKGAGPCSLEEAKQRLRDPVHPWFGGYLHRVDIHTALNALIQGSAARHTKLWMRACWREGVVPMLQMHDGLECSVTAPEQGELIARLACEAVELKVPMRADVKFGAHWGDARHSWQELREGAAPKLIFREVRLELEPDLADDRVCVHCRLDPPDGSEVLSAYNDQWLHPRCQDAFIHTRMTEENIVWEAPQFAIAPGARPQSPSGETHMLTPDEPTPGNPTALTNGHAGGNGFSHALSRDGRHPHSSDGNLHGDEGPVAGTLTGRWFYPYLDRAPYLRVDRHDLPNAERRFFQHHWNGKDWICRVKGTYAERKVPYRLPELAAALRANPDVEVQICEGESDTDAMAKLGFVATTNPGGALGWTPELTSWLRVLGARNAAIHEDNDGEAHGFKGPKRSALLAAELADFMALKIVRYPDVPEGQDVRWWLEHGHSKTELEARIASAEPADGSIMVEPHQFRSEADIPRWQFLYGRHLLREEVSGTAAMGGTGKSSLSIAEALAQTSGKAILGEQVPRPLRVVLINLEDTRNTMDKRIAAVMRHYGLTPADIGDRLIVKAKGEIKIKVARVARSGDVVRNRPIIRGLVKLMQDQNADVLSIDSFIRTHEVNENDNSAMLEVVECFETVAQEGKCAVHLWHHTRKASAGEQTTVASARGAGAIADAFRSYRMLETMTSKEHAQLLGIAPDLLPPGFYFRGFNGKRNFAPPAEHSDWFKLVNVEIANGDALGVATSWAYPATMEAIPAPLAARILTDIGRGIPNGRRFSNHNRAGVRSAWPIVQKYCPTKTEAQCRHAIGKWVTLGALYEDTYYDPIDRKDRLGLFAREAAEELPPELDDDEA